MTPAERKNDRFLALQNPEQWRKQNTLLATKKGDVAGRALARHLYLHTDLTARTDQEGKRKKVDDVLIPRHRWIRWKESREVGHFDLSGWDELYERQKKEGLVMVDDADQAIVHERDDQREEGYRDIGASHQESVICQNELKGPAEALAIKNL